MWVQWVNNILLRITSLLLFYCTVLCRETAIPFRHLPNIYVLKNEVLLCLNVLKGALFCCLWKEASLLQTKGGPNLTSYAG